MYEGYSRFNGIGRPGGRVVPIALYVLFQEVGAVGVREGRATQSGRQGIYATNTLREQNRGAPRIRVYRSPIRVSPVRQRFVHVYSLFHIFTYSLAH